MNRSSILRMIRDKQARATCAALMALSGGAAMAQTVDPFDTAVTTITDKVTSYGGSLVGVSAVAVVFYVAIKFVKKLPRAA